MPTYGITGLWSCSNFSGRRKRPLQQTGGSSRDVLLSVRHEITVATAPCGRGSEGHLQSRDRRERSRNWPTYFMTDAKAERDNSLAEGQWRLLADQFHRAFELRAVFDHDVAGLDVAQDLRPGSKQ